MTRIVIDYESDPDFSLLDLENPDQQYVSLCTCLYDGDRLIGSLGDSIFYEDEDDWTIGTFATVDDIPARCQHLREVAAELIREHKRTMKKYTVTIAANVRAYATVTIEAADEDAAWQRAKDIAAALPDWTQGEPTEIDGVVFEPDYATLTDFEALDDILPCDREG